MSESKFPTHNSQIEAARERLRLHEARQDAATTVFHPLFVYIPAVTSKGAYPLYPYEGMEKEILRPDFGTPGHLRNPFECSVHVHGLRVLNPAWDVAIVSMGEYLKTPCDAVAFNLDAVPGPPHTPSPIGEAPRFVHYPLGVLGPKESLPIRIAPFGTPSVPPTFSAIFFVTTIIERVQETP